MPKQHCIHGEENCNRCAMNDVEAPTINLNIVLDFSTSMLNRWDQTISGLNEYITTLRHDESDYLVSLYTFGLSSELTARYKNVTLDQIEKFDKETFRPNGSGTALWDAVGQVLSKVETAEPVLFVIITDGDENASHLYDSKAVNELIEARTKLGNYTFAYLGVTKDAWGNAAKSAVLSSSSLNVSASDYGASTYKSLSSNTIGYSSLMRSSRSLNRNMRVDNLFNSSAMAAADNATMTATVPDNPVADIEVEAGDP